MTFLNKNEIIHSNQFFKFWYVRWITGDEFKLFPLVYIKESLPQFTNTKLILTPSVGDKATLSKHTNTSSLLRNLTTHMALWVYSLTMQEAVDSIPVQYKHVL
jgi:hypothetical protein